MGSSQSTQVDEEAGEEEEEEEDEEEEEEEDDNDETERRELINPLTKKVLEQEPELLPYHASASPLSPQLSNFGTPRLGPSIKVWDPYNVLAPPPQLPPPPTFSPNYSSETGFEIDQVVTEVFLINHGECSVNLSPDLVGGRWAEADLTSNGKRQARAMAVFLNSQGVRFNAVYSSPLDRARMTAISVCQELNFAEDQIQSADELLEMSHGQWEGCLRTEIYTADVVNLIDKLQPDFSAPSGESLRQVEFRMMQFINGTILQLPEKLRIGDISLLHRNSKSFSEHDSHVLPNSAHDQVGLNYLSLHSDLNPRHRQGLTKKKSGKSRLQYVTTTGHHDTEDDISGRASNRHDHLHEINGQRSSSACSSVIAVFTHAVPIKCLITSVLGCSPAMSHKICIDDSSVTVLQHSLRTGWQLQRLNDTAHLRLL